MKRIIIYSIFVFATCSISAQNYAKHEFVLRGGVGATSLNASTAGVTNKGGFGGNAGLGYNYFFSSRFGIGTGLELGFYNAKSTADLLTASYQAYDKVEQENFNFSYNFVGFEEKQSITMFTIPLLVNFQTGVKNKFYASAGFRIAIPVGKSIEQTATNLLTTGTYAGFPPFEGDVPESGFVNIDNYSASSSVELNTSFMLSLEAGMRWKLTENWGLYTGLYLDYGLNNIRKTNNKQVVQYQTDAPASLQANSVLNTSWTSKVHPMSYGLRISVAFGKTTTNHITE